MTTAIKAKKPATKKAATTSKPRAKRQAIPVIRALTNRQVSGIVHRSPWGAELATDVTAGLTRIVARQAKRFDMSADAKCTRRAQLRCEMGVC